MFSHMKSSCLQSPIATHPRRRPTGFVASFASYVKGSRGTTKRGGRGRGREVRKKEEERRNDLFYYSARDILRLAGLSVQILSPTEPREEPKQCKVCRFAHLSLFIIFSLSFVSPSSPPCSFYISYDCFLSSITCSCSPQYVACIAHHAEVSILEREERRRRDERRKWEGRGEVKDNF